jgi:hypothetical protein
MTTSHKTLRSFRMLSDDGSESVEIHVEVSEVELGHGRGAERIAIATAAARSVCRSCGRSSCTTASSNASAPFGPGVGTVAWVMANGAHGFKVDMRRPE